VRIIKKIFISVALLSLTFCIGCATLGITKQAEEDEAVFLEPEEVIAVNPDLRFDDLPIPIGFLIDLQNSYAFQNPTTRVALLRYFGRDSTRGLVEFFTEQMPRYNWALINQVEFEKVVLNFGKAQESCIIMIEPQRGKTLVTISIAPR